MIVLDRSTAPWTAVDGVPAQSDLLPMCQLSAVCLCLEAGCHRKCSHVTRACRAARVLVRGGAETGRSCGRQRYDLVGVWGRVVRPPPGPEVVSPPPGSWSQAYHTKIVAEMSGKRCEDRWIQGGTLTYIFFQGSPQGSTCPLCPLGCVPAR